MAPRTGNSPCPVCNPRRRVINTKTSFLPPHACRRLVRASFRGFGSGGRTCIGEFPVHHFWVLLQAREGFITGSVACSAVQPPILPTTSFVFIQQCQAIKVSRAERPTSDQHCFPPIIELRPPPLLGDVVPLQPRVPKSTTQPMDLSYLHNPLTLHTNTNCTILDGLSMLVDQMSGLGSGTSGEKS